MGGAFFCLGSLYCCARECTMNDKELFNVIKNTEYKKAGLDVDYAIIEKYGIIYLLFQQSKDKLDWKINFQFWAKPYKNQKNPMLIHRGFVKAWKSCNDVIMEELLEKIEDNPYKIVVIAGWSYGGAMALLAVEDFNFRTGKTAELVTFGAPKIIAPFAFKTKKHLIQCVNRFLTPSKIYCHKSDIVPMIPPFYLALQKNKVGNFNLKLFFTGKGHRVYGD